MAEYKRVTAIFTERAGDEGLSLEEAVEVSYQLTAVVIDPIYIHNVYRVAFFSLLSHMYAALHPTLPVRPGVPSPFIYF